MVNGDKNKRCFMILKAIVTCLVMAGTAEAYWQQRAKLLASDGAVEDAFGTSVSISGNYAIAGAPGSTSSLTGRPGSAYIFEFQLFPIPGRWVERAKLLASDGAEGDRFGRSVSISGDYAIVGAPYVDMISGPWGDRTDAGSSYIFKREGGTWTQKTKLLASDGAKDDIFGSSVCISGNYAIAGADGDDDNGSFAGSAYVFEEICPPADLTGDCFVGFPDFAIMASQWMQD